MIYVESPGTDPYFNLAMEQYLFDTIGRENEIFFLWQNDNAIIIGKNQNTIAEINKEFAAEKEIKVVRRLSGGGAVYHDLGNLNFTFIVDAGKAESLDMGRFTEPVAALLRSLGADAEAGGRNDILIGGKKVSGNAQYTKNGRCMHHGTIIFDSDLEMVERALVVTADKLQSKGAKSIRSRVTTVLEHLARKLSLGEFKDLLKQSVLGDDFTEYALTADDISAIERLKNARYAAWEWNYGASPRFSLRKNQRFEGCGNIEVYLEAAGGIVEAVQFFGDFFGSRDLAELGGLLAGCRLEEQAIRSLLQEVDIGEYFHNLTLDDFIGVLV